MGPFNSRRMGLIGTAAFELKEVGDVAGSIRVGKNWSIIQLLEIVPSRTKTFEESWVNAHRQWRIAKTEELQEALRSRLRDKFSITIYDDELAKVWPEESPKLTPTVTDSARTSH